jgi:hypothetical protein
MKALRGSRVVVWWLRSGEHKIEAFTHLGHTFSNCTVNIQERSAADAEVTGARKANVATSLLHFN